MIFAGIDAGSRSIKIVLYDADRKALVADGAVDQGVAQETLARQLYEQLLEQSGLRSSDVARVVATGYGRNAITFADTTITEITCHARGVRHAVPDAMTIIDIGGQDSKLIRLDRNGAVRDFAMNDRCAAGTGRFMEMAAARLDVAVAALGELASQVGPVFQPDPSDRSGWKTGPTSAAHPVTISSMCAVFAETEIIGLLASGASPPDIARGIQLACAKRVVAMAGRHAEPPVVFTGGVALVSGMSSAMETALGQPVAIAPNPQMTGALGAALLAEQRARIS